LREALKRGLDKDEISKLSDLSIWRRPQFWLYSLFALGLIAGVVMAIWLSPQFFQPAIWSLPPQVAKQCVSGSNPTEIAAKLSAKLREGTVLARGRRIVFNSAIRDFLVEKEVTELRPGDWQNLELSEKLDSAAGPHVDRYTALEMKVVGSCR